jgi:hypothetical protein
MKLLPVPLCCKYVQLLAQLLDAYVRKGTSRLPLLLLIQLAMLLLTRGRVCRRVCLAA